VELPIKINLANSRRIAFSLKSFMTSGGLDGIDTGLDGAPGHKDSTTLHNFAQLHSQRKHSQLKVQQSSPPEAFFTGFLSFFIVDSNFL
jgi:hypothetical protein